MCAMNTPFPNCKSLKWLTFVLILFSFNQNTIGHNLANRCTLFSEIGTKNICNRTEYLTIDVFPENDFNEAPFNSQLFSNFLNINISNQCKDGIIMYFKEVINLKPWALEMLDASGKLPSSFFGQTMIDYGSLEDCIKIKAISNDGAGLFTGKYCMMHLRHPLFQTPNHNPQFEKSYNQAFGVPPDWIRYDIENDLPLRFGFYGGICMPSSCTDEDLNKAISTLSEPLNLDVTLTDCQVEEPLRFPVSAILSMIFLVVLLLVCASGTILDLKDRKRKENKLKYPESLTRQVLKGFSLYTNTKELFAENVKKTSLDYLNGLRVLLCVLTVWAHAMIYPTFWKELRYRNFHLIFEFMDYILENNGPVMVDCFITIRYLKYIVLYLYPVSTLSRFPIIIYLKRTIFEKY
nr:nose resistant to fluoxetine protein 6-like isoform X2 [Parasteatoda tepidariorum]